MSTVIVSGLVLMFAAVVLAALLVWVVPGSHHETPWSLGWIATTVLGGTGALVTAGGLWGGEGVLFTILVVAALVGLIFS